jgi:hypothetical protein
VAKSFFVGTSSLESGGDFLEVWSVQSGTMIARIDGRGLLGKFAPRPLQAYERRSGYVAFMEVCV